MISKDFLRSNCDMLLYQPGRLSFCSNTSATWTGFGSGSSWNSLYHSRYLCCICIGTPGDEADVPAKSCRSRTGFRHSRSCSRAVVPDTMCRHNFWRDYFSIHERQLWSRNESVEIRYVNLSSERGRRLRHLAFLVTWIQPEKGNYSWEKHKWRRKTFPLTFLRAPCNWNDLPCVRKKRKKMKTDMKLSF